MQKVLDDIPDGRLRAYIVWEPMIPGDSREWAEARTREFSDKRLRYFWDGGRLTGKEWQKVLGTKRAAWDVYLLYGTSRRWGSQPLLPDFWMHQLNDETIAPRLDESAFEVVARDLLNQR